MTTRRPDPETALLELLSATTGLTAEALLVHESLVSDGAIESLRLIELFFELERLYGEDLPTIVPADFESFAKLRDKLSSRERRDA